MGDIYEFQRIPFGLRNAPSTFQQCMHGVLEWQAAFSSPYIDDILIYSNSWADHIITHIKAVLGALSAAGLTANPAKCQWGAHALTYLGYEVGVGKIGVLEARVKAIREYKCPQTKEGLKAFLGTTGYYRRFVPEWLGHYMAALRKVAPNVLSWSIDIMLNAFNYLINALCSSHVLWLPRPGDQLVLHTDASTQGIGAVLSEDRDGVQCPLGYYSKRLLPAETNYAATELEYLAVFKAIAVHLVGCHFTVVTDHRALMSLLTSTKLNGRLMQWGSLVDELIIELYVLVKLALG